MTETIHGPVDSAITQLLQHFEVSMWACGVEPETAMQVLNLVLFGSRTGGPSGSIKPTPSWAENIADRVLLDLHTALSAQGQDEYPEADAVRLITLALVRQVLQGQSGQIEQVLSQ